MLDMETLCKSRESLMKNPSHRSSPEPANTFQRTLPLLLAATLLLAIASTPAAAQKDTGGIAGIVKDATNALVAGAKVTVTDVDRGTAFVTSTNAQGEYVASPLKIGRYQVTIEKQGFKRVTAGPVTVDVQARPAVDVTLQVGSISESMTVTAVNPQLETDTSELGQV